MCLDKEILHFQNKKVIIFPFYNEEKHFYAQIEANQIMIKNSEELHFKPHEIRQFDLNFTSNVKHLPTIEINENLPILICPDVLQSSQITVSKISLYNTLNGHQILEKDTKIIYFSYGKKDQILGIPSSQHQIYLDDKFISSIIQSNFSQNIAAVTERFARNLIFQESALENVFYSDISKKPPAIKSDVSRKIPETILMIGYTRKIGQTIIKNLLQQNPISQEKLL